jgi:hypothetical protein
VINAIAGGAVSLRNLSRAQAGDVFIGKDADGKSMVLGHASPAVSLQPFSTSSVLTDVQVDGSRIILRALDSNGNVVGRVEISTR